MTRWGVHEEISRGGERRDRMDPRRLRGRGENLIGNAPLSERSGPLINCVHGSDRSGCSRGGVTHRRCRAPHQVLPRHGRYREIGSGWAPSRGRRRSGLNTSVPRSLAPGCRRTLRTPDRSNEMEDVPVPAPGVSLGGPMPSVACWSVWSQMWWRNGFVAGSYIPAMPSTESVCQGLQRPPRRLPRRGKKSQKIFVAVTYRVVTARPADGQSTDGRTLRRPIRAEPVPGDATARWERSWGRR